MIMKKSFSTFISCIFIITIFFGGMCLDKVQVYSCDTFSDNYNTISTSNSSKVIATPMPSIDDSRPCTTEMLGNSSSNIIETIPARIGVRYITRFSEIILADILSDITNNSYHSTYIRTSEYPVSTATFVISYIHNKDGEK